MNGRPNWQLAGYTAAYAWLARDPLPNLEMILTLLNESLGALVVLGMPPTIRGVLMETAHPFRPGDCYRLDAIDSPTLAELIHHPTVAPAARWLMHRPWMLPLLPPHHHLVATGFGIYSFALSQPSTLPGSGRLLGPADRSLVERSDCGWSVADFDQLLHSRRLWAIVHDEMIVCRASSGYVTPWSEEVLGLWTARDERNHGLARSLVATICNDILMRKPLATYTTTFENVASQHVAQAVGFKQITTTTEYIHQ